MASPTGVTAGLRQGLHQVQLFGATELAGSRAVSRLGSLDL